MCVCIQVGAYTYGDKYVYVYKDTYTGRDLSEAQVVLLEFKHVGSPHTGTRNKQHPGPKPM